MLHAKIIHEISTEIKAEWPKKTTKFYAFLMGLLVLYCAFDWMVYTGYMFFEKQRLLKTAGFSHVGEGL